MLFVSSELVLMEFFFPLAFKITPETKAVCMLAVWEVTTPLVLLLHSLKGLSVGIAAFLQHWLKIPLLAFSAVYNF